MLRTYLYIPQHLNDEVEKLAEDKKTSKADLMRTALKEGLKQIKRQAGTAKIMYRVCEIGEKYGVKGPKDGAKKIDEYLWDKDWSEND